MKMEIIIFTQQFKLLIGDNIGKEKLPWRHRVITAGLSLPVISLSVSFALPILFGFQIPTTSLSTNKMVLSYTTLLPIYLKQIPSILWQINWKQWIIHNENIYYTLKRPLMAVTYWTNIIRLSLSNSLTLLHSTDNLVNELLIISRSSLFLKQE